MRRESGSSSHWFLLPCLFPLACAAALAQHHPISEGGATTTTRSFARSQEEAQRDEIYVSTDIEADGPIPGPHSMVSFGSAAFKANGELISTFSANLRQLENAKGHPDTMAWWRENPTAWEASRTNLREPEEAITEYVEWIDALPGQPVFVGYPAAFDFMFVKWYLMRFVGRSPFGHSALDIRSYAMAVLGVPYRETTKSKMPKRWIPEAPHTHVALDDAIEQGMLFCNILAEGDRGRAEASRDAAERE